MSDDRLWAAQLYVNAMRTGEASASARAVEHLAPDAVLVAGKDEFKGAAEVAKRITGIWPLTPVYLHGAWSVPVEAEGVVKIGAQFGNLGAAPAAIALTFSFDGQNRISRIVQETTPVPPAVPTDTIPDFVRGIVNGALANGTVMSITYVDESGQPVTSLRGSVQTYGDHQLSAWLRNAEGGMAKALAKNPKMSLLYRDSRTRTTLMFQGIGHIEADETVRKRVYELTPEVEQTHDPARQGAALIIDITRLQGGNPRSLVRMERKA